MVVLTHYTPAATLLTTKPQLLQAHTQGRQPSTGAEVTPLTAANQPYPPQQQQPPQHAYDD